MKEKIRNMKKVLRIAKKPSKQDFLKSLKICILGIMAIGLIGFLFYLLFSLIVGI